MSPAILTETNWKNVRDEKNDILIWAVTKAHDYHLPYVSEHLPTAHIQLTFTPIA